MHMYFCSTIYSAHIIERRFEKIKWEKCYHSSGFQPRLNKQTTEHFRRIWCYSPNEKLLYAGFTTRKTNIPKWEQFKSRYFHESYDMTPYLDMDSWIKKSVSRLQLLEWLTLGANFCLEMKSFVSVTHKVGRRSIVAAGFATISYPQRSMIRNQIISKFSLL